MVDDAQTHTLPADAAGLRRIALFLGFADAGRLRRRADAHHSPRSSAIMRISSRKRRPWPRPGNLVFTGIEDDPETLEDAARASASPIRAAISAIVRGWHHGRYRATRSQRARELLTELVPALLEAFGAAANPDAAFLRFDQFLGAPAGGRAALLAVLPTTRRSSRWSPRSWARGRGLPTQIARRPALLDGVLAARLLRPAAAARGRSPRDLGSRARPRRAITRSCSTSRGAGSPSASSRSACSSCAAGSTARRRAAPSPTSPRRRSPRCCRASRPSSREATARSPAARCGRARARQARQPRDDGRPPISTSS